MQARVGAGNGNGEALHARAGDAAQAGEANWDGGTVQAGKADGVVSAQRINNQLIEEIWKEIERG